MYTSLTHMVVQHTQHCKAIILQFKKYYQKKSWTETHPSKPHEQKSVDTEPVHHISCPQNQDDREAAGIYSWNSPLALTWVEAEKEH